MTHAYATADTDPDAAQPGPPPPAEQQPTPDRSPLPVRPITELIAGALSGLHVAYGDLTRLVSVVTEDGAIVVDVERLSVTGPEVTVRTVLTLSEPRHVAPERTDQADTEIEASAT